MLRIGHISKSVAHRVDQINLSLDPSLKFLIWDTTGWRCVLRTTPSNTPHYIKASDQCQMRYSAMLRSLGPGRVHFPGFSWRPTSPIQSTLFSVATPLVFAYHCVYHRTGLHIPHSSSAYWLESCLAVIPITQSYLQWRCCTTHAPCTATRMGPHTRLSQGHQWSSLTQWEFELAFLWLAATGKCTTEGHCHWCSISWWLTSF